ncbi:hypothetical protein RclHR1_11780008 [Rhizophagus clarus]|nr:hypothetical protein RclHR1_11780008 [Rhizophagus clarus]
MNIFDINVEEFMKPFIPLIKEAAISITIINYVYQSSQYNKKICNSLLDRAKLAEFVIDQLIRKRNENIKNFKNFAWYKSFIRLVDILTEIKVFSEKISQLHEIKRFLGVKNIEKRFEILITEYDNVMMELNFTVAITNEQQRQIDHENLKDDLSEIDEFFEKFDSIENNLETSIIYEEVLNMVENRKTAEVKDLGNNKLTEPRVLKDDDIRGYFKRKIYMNTIEVACVTFHDDEPLPYQNDLAAYIKATQSPNIIRFYGFAEFDGFKVMVSEWAEFGDLRNIYLRGGIIPLKLKLTYVLGVCRAIAYLNALGFYYKELRCSKVVVTAENIAKIKFSKQDRPILEVKIVRWCAPEAFRNGKFNQKSEIYSIGMLLWELIFERLPYENRDVIEIFNFVKNGGRETVQFDHNSSGMINIQNGLEKIIRKAWSHDPYARMSISKLFIDLDILIKSLEEIEDNHSEVNSNDFNNDNEVDNNINLKLENPDNNNKNEEHDYDSKSIQQKEIIPISSIYNGIKAHKAKNYEEAWKCFKMNAENQHPLGKYWLGYYLWEGKFVQKDKKAGFGLYKEAANDFIADAQYRYTFALVDKDIRSELIVDKKEVLKSLQLAAEYGSGQARFIIGNAYLKETFGYKKNLEMAILWYKRAALRNNEAAKEKLKELGIEFSHL